MLFKVLLMSLTAAAITLFAADNLGISAQDVQFDTNTGNAIATDDVTITYEGYTLTADRVIVNQTTLDFTAEGNVKINKDDGTTLNSQSLIKGNFKTKEFSFGPFRYQDEDCVVTATSGGYDTEGTMTLKNGTITTCDKEHPHYHVKAKSAKYYQNKSFSAYNITLNAFNIPIFYLPYAWGKTNGTGNFIIRPGYDGKNGFFLRFGYFWKTTDRKGELVLYTDLTTRRGNGVGAEAEYQKDDIEFEALAYDFRDKDTPITRRYRGHNYNRRFLSRKDRNRINVYYSQKLMEDLTIRLNYDHLSDIDMLENFFTSDYLEYQQPKSYLDISYDTDFFHLGLTARPRVNDFYTVVETLPEVRLSIPRINLGTEWLQYQSDTRAGYYAMRWRKNDLSRRLFIRAADYDPFLHIDPKDYQTWRFHTQHFLYLPIDLDTLGILTPRAGFAFTAYSKSSDKAITGEEIASMIDADNQNVPKNKATVRTYDSQGGAVGRLAYEFGIELKNRFYSDWHEAEWPFFEMDGVRHVIEPYINYTYMPNPSHNRDHLYYFDEIDRLDEQHFVRFGLDQRLITRTNDATRPILRLETYYDQHFIANDDNGAYPGDFGNRLSVAVRPNVTFYGTLLYDIGTGHLWRGETGLSYGIPKTFTFTLSYIFRNDHYSRSVYSLGSTLTDITGESSYIKKNFESTDMLKATLKVPITSTISTATTWKYDFEKNRFISQRYEIRKNLHCWDLVLQFNYTYHDFKGLVVFELKQFPEVRLFYGYQ